MRQQLRQIAVVLMRELLRPWMWKRVDWRKLFFVGAAMSTIGILVPTFVFSYPLSIWFLSSPQAMSSYTPVNDSILLRVTVIEEKGEKLHFVSADPVLSLNSTLPSKKERARVSGKRSSEPRRRRKKNKEHDDAKAAKIVPPPPRSPVSASLKRYIWSLSPNDALIYAKKEIEKAPVLTDDPYLHAPVFRNFSVFKRSYELMELILKVYIYPDGKSPIFHEPHLYGIYASEGWFMKLMEANRQFVTKDPEKAHLFYLPYSARQLELALYVPNSHNLRPLAVFMRDYANMLAAKYPFWNRTHGSDHFIVACHDWGPYTLTMHKELAKNTIKAVCNADTSEGIFVAGRDVSLPETTIRNPKRPLRNIGGGMRVSQRPILAFFAGNMHGRARPTLLKYWHNKDEDMKIYRLLPVGISRNTTYIQHMKSSKYCLCPMGYEVNSPRIVEAIYYECVPVIIADNFVLPFNEVLDWSTFSIVVAEKDIPKLKEILLAVPLRRLSPDWDYNYTKNSQCRQQDKFVLRLRKKDVAAGPGAAGLMFRYRSTFNQKTGKIGRWKKALDRIGIDVSGKTVGSSSSFAYKIGIADTSRWLWFYKHCFLQNRIYYVHINKYSSDIYSFLWKIYTCETIIIGNDSTPLHANDRLYHHVTAY